MKKKLILAAAGVLSIFTLAACTGGSQDIATMKGGTITVDDFFNQTKSSQQSQQIVQQMIIYKVFDQKYGKDVSEKDIQAQFDETKKNIEAQGGVFADQLKQAGLTEKSYKEQIKQSLAYKAGIKAHIKITDEDLKAAWETFHPEVEAQIIQVATEDEAKEIKKQLDNGDDFAKIAKDKSTDTTTAKDGGKVKFDSQTETIPEAVKTAAFKLKDGEISEPIQATDSTGYQSTFTIVKMVKNKDKGNDMAPFKKELTKIAETAKQNDQEFVQKVTSEVLTAANVKIKDDAFKDVLAGLVETKDSAKSSDSSKKEEKESSSKEKESKSSDSEKSKDSSSKTEESSSKTEESSK
ncbi:peptidylprolyl isomerase [Enterococcus ureilyticus]|uniref:Foldase protein PrsA n=1 Tax=Enterococcus ureilyticus TaxID=1131292 RepID=A0A1E5HBF3_9ENTE|nr:peptidylprolyl isomerase [Enterococcus ureilyticus]MBM7690318.1 foldase protein PrsA [Enterococcus ureilyticus]MBO0447214.1 peptidylprolyl isomerase [Enterococcus ureilyticus]OEG22166.1 peptidylprolyl isomerase [Enterococcus ureilyticus]